MQGRIEVIERLNMKYRDIAFRVVLRKMYFPLVQEGHWHVLDIELPNREWGYPWESSMPYAPETIPEDKAERINYVRREVEEFADIRLDTLKWGRAKPKPTEQLEMDL